MWWVHALVHGAAHAGAHWANGTRVQGPQREAYGVVGGVLILVGLGLCLAGLLLSDFLLSPGIAFLTLIGFLPLVAGMVLLGAALQSEPSAYEQTEPEPSKLPDLGRLPPPGQDCSPRDKGLILTDELDEKELIDRLGTPLTTFRPSLANLIAGIILALLIVGGGSVGAVALMLATHKPQDVTGTVIVALFLAGLAVGGVLLLCWIRSVISLRVLVCPRGFIQVARGKARGCCWDQVSEMKVMVYKGHGQCTVRRQDGRTFVFTTNGVHRIDKLITIFSFLAPMLRVPGAVTGRAHDNPGSDA